VAPLACKSTSNILGSDTADQVAVKNFNQLIGILGSALEHAVPEQMLVFPVNPGEAVSAVKAITKATAQGQRIYHITQSNQSTALVNIDHNPETMAEISDALAVGREVITHTDPISIPGWSGAGYIIFDSETGDGAYKISGGMNGGNYPLNPQQGDPMQAMSISPDDGTILLSIFAAASVLLAYMLALVGSGPIAVGLALLVNLLGAGAIHAFDADAFFVYFARIVFVASLVFLMPPLQIIVFMLLTSVISLLVSAILTYLEVANISRKGWQMEELGSQTYKV